MGWERESTSTSIDIDVDLDEFKTEQLLQELMDRGVITEADAVALNSKKNAPKISLTVNHSFIADALDYKRRGNRHEALHMLERALGSEWLQYLTGEPT
jgi:hypothetical protein